MLVAAGLEGRVEDAPEEEEESDSEPDSSLSRALAAAATAAYPTRGALTVASTMGRVEISFPFPLASRRAWRAGTRGASSSEEEEPSELEEESESEAAARLFLLRGLRLAAAAEDLGAMARKLGKEEGGSRRERKEGE